MQTFAPIHSLELHENGVTDSDTLDFTRDTRAMYRSLYQGMAPVGEWIQSRVACLVREWLPGWMTSHGQIADLGKPTVQSRSWDIIVHRPIPDSWGFPPPASPSGPWALVPKELCCAVVDTKGRYNTPRDYAKKPVFDLYLTPDRPPQLPFLHPIVPILFIIASTYAPETVEAAGLDCGLPTFVVAKAVEHKGPRGTEAVDWVLHPGRNGVVPIQEFREALLAASEQWHMRSQARQSGEQSPPAYPEGRADAPSRSAEA
jgi:hypothetical protein